MLPFPARFAPTAKALLVAGWLLASADSRACSGRYPPEARPRSEYREVFLGEIVGVHLTEYAKHRLDALSPSAAQSDDPLHGFLPTSSTPEFEVTLFVLDSYGGQTPASVTLALAGCGVRVPALKSRALFLVPRDGSIPVMVPTTDASFDRWLGIAQTPPG